MPSIFEEVAPLQNAAFAPAWLHAKALMVYVLGSDVNVERFCMTCDEYVRSHDSLAKRARSASALYVCFQRDSTRARETCTEHTHRRGERATTDGESENVIRSVAVIDGCVSCEL